MVDHLTAHVRAAPMAAAPTGPLRGVRIIDLTHALSGPFCTMLLADLGADVVKIEPPSGDVTRLGGPFTRDDTERHYGGFFASVNRNKRSVVLDLVLPDDRRTFLRLVETADVVVENFRAGVMERLDVGYETLREINPRLVYGAIRGFGDPRTGTSPYVDWPAYDVVAQAMSGAVNMNGTADGQRLRVGTSIGDLYPATMAALGICAAVLEARTSGVGQFVDVAMYDALVALCEATVYRYSYTGVIDAPAGNGHYRLVPFNIYTTLDGSCAIAAPTDGLWKVLCQLIEREDLIDDARTSEYRNRYDNRDMVNETVETWTAKRTTAEVVKILGGTVPVGPVHTNADLFDDPHLYAREMLVAVEHAGAERPVVFPNSPIHYTRTRAGIYRRPPKLGEHTAEVLAELGLPSTDDSTTSKGDS